MDGITVPYKMEKIGGYTTVFMFDKLFDFPDFINQVEKIISTGNARNQLNEFNSSTYVSGKIRREGARVFGTTDAELVKSNYTTYLFNNELSQFIEGLRNKTVKSDIVDIDQKKKMQFTSQEIGIFSFDLASLGLIKVYVYFSEAMNDFVDGNYVKSRRLSNGKVEFYFIGLPAIKRHKLIVTETGLWSTVLRKQIPDAQAEKIVNGEIVSYYFPEQLAIPEHVVEQRQAIENGRPKFTTTWKKSFIHIPKVVSKIPRIDIIINSSYSYSVKGDTEMIWSCMAGIALAEKLQQAGVDFRIFVSYSARFMSKNVFTFVKVKDANEPVNINAIAIAASDPRQFRYLGFKGFVTTAWEAGYDSFITAGIGTPINDSDEIKEAFISYLKKVKDFDQSDTIIKNSKIVFTQALSESAAIGKFNDAVEAISKVTYN